MKVYEFGIDLIKFSKFINDHNKNFKVYLFEYVGYMFFISQILEVFSNLKI